MEKVAVRFFVRGVVSWRRKGFNSFGEELCYGEGKGYILLERSCVMEKVRVKFFGRGVFLWRR